MMYVKKYREEAILVDQNDEIIGYKYRDELQPTDRFRIVAIWLENHLGQALIAQRSPQKKLHPELWGPAAAGGVEKGETYEESAYKELAEEIGITDVALQPITKELLCFQDDNVQRYCQWFFGQIETTDYDSFKLRQEEVAAVKWVDKPWVLRDVMDHPEIYTPSSASWPKLFG